MYRFDSFDYDVHGIAYYAYENANKLNKYNKPDNKPI